MGKEEEANVECTKVAWSSQTEERQDNSTEREMHVYGQGRGGNVRKYCMEWTYSFGGTPKARQPLMSCLSPVCLSVYKWNL